MARGYEVVGQFEISLTPRFSEVLVSTKIAGPAVLTAYDLNR